MEIKSCNVLKFDENDKIFDNAVLLTFSQAASVKIRYLCSKIKRIRWKDVKHGKDVNFAKQALR